MGDLSVEQASELVGDDIAYWLTNPFMDRDAIQAKVCHWITTAGTESRSIRVTDTHASRINAAYAHESEDQ